MAELCSKFLGYVVSSRLKHEIENFIRSSLIAQGLFVKFEIIIWNNDLYAQFDPDDLRRNGLIGEAQLFEERLPFFEDLKMKIEKG